MSDVKTTSWAPFSFGFALVLFFSVLKLKIHRFRCRKKKILYPYKMITFAQVTQRNFCGEVSGSWAEYIFDPLHQGRTYSPEGVGK